MSNRNKKSIYMKVGLIEKWACKASFYNKKYAKYVRKLQHIKSWFKIQLGYNWFYMVKPDCIISVIVDAYGEGQHDIEAMRFKDLISI